MVKILNCFFVFMFFVFMFILIIVKRADKFFGGVFIEMFLMWTDIKNVYNVLY